MNHGLPELTNLCIKDHYARLLLSVPALYSEPEQKSLFVLLSLAPPDSHSERKGLKMPSSDQVLQGTAMQAALKARLPSVIHLLRSIATNYSSFLSNSNTHTDQPKHFDTLPR
jgi:hypothetical protein